MLEEMRKPGRAKSFVAYVIFGAIILVFVFMGMTPDQQGPMGGATAAVVDKTVVSLADFRDEVRRMEEQFPSDAIPEAQRTELSRYMRSQALQNLIARRVLSLSAGREGVKVSDLEVAAQIGSIPVFKEEGIFQREMYSQYLTSARISAKDFEERIRSEILVQKTIGLFTRAAYPVKQEVFRDQALAGTKLSVSVLTFGLDDLEDAIAVSSSEIQSFLSEPSKLETLQKIFEARVSDFSTPEEVRARHILVRIDSSKGRAEPEAKKFIEELRLRAEKEDFAKLATEFSDDVMSKPRGGDLGYFSRGRLSPEIESAAFSLETGAVSAVIRTEDGFNLIKVEDKKAAQTKSFDEVKNQLARDEIAKSKTSERIEALKQMAADSSKHAQLQQEIKTLGFKWESGDVDLSSNTLPGLGSDEKVMDVLVKRGQSTGLLPQLLESQGRFVLVRTDKMTTAKVEEIKDFDRMSGMIAQRRAGELLNSWVKEEALKAKVKRNEALVAQ